MSSTDIAQQTTTLRTALQKAGLANRYVDYTPQFNLEEFQPGVFWIKDGAVNVGLVIRAFDFAELVNTDPLLPHEATYPEIYHAPTAPGERITLAKWINAQATTSDAQELTFDVQPDGVTACFTERWANGDTGSKRITWRVDADFGYIMHCVDDLAATQADPHQHANNVNYEYCNFLAAHVVDDRPEFQRYPYILWQHPSGKIVRWNHNNVGARALGVMDTDSRRRVRTGGFVGNFGQQDYNIAVDLLASSPSSTSGTCPNMFDEHLTWVPARVEPAPRGEDGRHLFHAEYHVVAVPPAVGDALAAQAEMVDMVLDRYDADLAAAHAWAAHEFPVPPGMPKSLAYCPFVSGQVTDFEHKLDPGASLRCSVFICGDDEDEAPVTVVSDCGHSGTHSLRVRAQGEPVIASPGQGASVHVTANQRYRLSAWVKSALTAGTVCLQADEWFFSPANPKAHHAGPSLSGAFDWQPLTLEFTAQPVAHCVTIELVADGTGDVWFDDVLLERIG